tara:strand:- start:17946 stop:19169 length:1224 start_codon:yes stop_codon:yes gene_type:complete
MNLIEGHIAIEPPQGATIWDVDPYDADILRAPEDYYAALREKGPFVYIPRYAILAVGRYQETRQVFSDHENFVSSRGVGLNDFKHEKPWRAPSIILEKDPPEHTRARKAMARALSPKAISVLKEDFRLSAERLVDALIAKGTFEAVTELAEAFPTDVFPRALGMTESDPRRLVDYGAMVFNTLGPDNELRRNMLAKAPDIVPWITAACAREKLTANGLGSIVYAAADAGEITQDEAGMLVRSFLSAGVDTTVTGIGNALWCFGRNPEQFDALRDDPKMARLAFDEVLRYTSPVHTFLRTAGSDTELAGVKIAEGTKVACALGAANLDPEKWKDPERFHIDRRPIGHLAFGAGIHGCVGQNLARAELEALLGVLAEKVARIEIVGDPVWRPNNAIHALDRMPMRFVKA